MHQGPQFHQRVLQGGACQQQSALGIEVQKNLPAFRLKVLDIVRFIQNHVHPFLSAEHRDVFDSQLIGGNAHLKGRVLRPSFSLFLWIKGEKQLDLSFLHRSVVRQHFH